MLLLIIHHTQVSFTVAIHNFMSLGSGSHVKPKQTVNKQKQTVNKQRTIDCQTQANSKQTEANSKQTEDNYALSCQEREKKEKTQTINHQ